MTNENLIRACHAESLANDISDFITQSNSDLHQAVQAELADINTSGGASGVVLGSASSTVDGTLWLEGENYSPVVKLFFGGNVYSFPTQPDFTVLDYSTATKGVTVTIESDFTSIVGSAYHDYIILDNSNNTLIGELGDGDWLEDSGTDNFVSVMSSNVYIYADGDNSTIFGGTGNVSIQLEGNSNYVDLIAGDNTVYCGTQVNARNNNTILGGTGNDSISFSGSNSYICAGTGSSTINNIGNNKKNTIYGGSGYTSIQSSYGSEIHLGSGESHVRFNYNIDKNYTIYGLKSCDNIVVAYAGGTIPYLYGFHNDENTIVMFVGDDQNLPDCTITAHDCTATQFYYDGELKTTLW